MKDKIGRYANISALNKIVLCCCVFVFFILSPSLIFLDSVPFYTIKSRLITIFSFFVFVYLFSKKIPSKEKINSIFLKLLCIFKYKYNCVLTSLIERFFILFLFNKHKINFHKKRIIFLLNLSENDFIDVFDVFFKYKNIKFLLKNDLFLVDINIEDKEAVSIFSLKNLYKRAEKLFLVINHDGIDKKKTESIKTINYISYFSKVNRNPSVHCIIRDPSFLSGVSSYVRLCEKLNINDGLTPLSIDDDTFKSTALLVKTNIFKIISSSFFEYKNISILYLTKQLECLRENIISNYGSFFSKIHFELDFDCEGYVDYIKNDHLSFLNIIDEEKYEIDKIKPLHMDGIFCDDREEVCIGQDKKQHKLFLIFFSIIMGVSCFYNIHYVCQIKEKLIKIESDSFSKNKTDLSCFDQIEGVDDDSIGSFKKASRWIELIFPYYSNQKLYSIKKRIISKIISHDFLKNEKTEDLIYTHFISYPNKHAVSLKEVIPKFCDVFECKEVDQSIPFYFTFIGYKALVEKDIVRYERNLKNLLSINDEIKITHPNDFNIFWKKYDDDYIHKWDELFSNLKTKKSKSISSEIVVLKSSKKTFYHLLNYIKDNTYLFSGKRTKIADSYSSINNFTIPTPKNLGKIREINKDIDELVAYLNIIKSSPNEEKASFDAMKSLFSQNEKNNPILVLSEHSKTLPYFLRSWINDILSNLLTVMLDESLLYVNSQWSSNVLPVFKEEIQNKFPFGKEENGVLDLDKAANFFREEGVFSKFIQEYLSPFVNTSYASWKSKEILSHTLPINKDSLNAIERVLYLSTYFSPSRSPSPIKFDFSPAYLSPKAKSLTFYIGEKEVSYRHGPQVVSSFTWPVSDKSISINIFDFNNEEYNLNYEGELALFKFFAQSHCKSRRDDALWSCEIRIKDLSFIYEVSFSGQAGGSLTQASRLTLPEHF